MLSQAVRQQKRFVETMPPHSSHAQLYSGQGIVLTGGGRYLTQTWVALNLLRAVNCSLPVELWIINGEEPPAALLPHLERLDVTVRHLDEILDRLGDSLANRVRGYAIKVFTILFSSFETVLYLDADNIPVRDPADLLSAAQVRQQGVLFWHDLWPVTVSQATYRRPRESKRIVTARKSCNLLTCHRYFYVVS